MRNNIEYILKVGHRREYEYWLNNDLFSLHWWAILILSILFLIMFFCLIDKSRYIFILLVFFINFVLIGTSDEIGKYFELWDYPYELLVFTHRFNTVDFSILPVMFTLVYQFFSKWKYYWIAHTIHCAFVSFIGIPIFIYFHLYRMDNWNMFLAFLVLFGIGTVSKFLCDLVYKKAHHN